MSKFKDQAIAELDNYSGLNEYQRKIIEKQIEENWREHEPHATLDEFVDLLIEMEGF